MLASQEFIPSPSTKQQLLITHNSWTTNEVAAENNYNYSMKDWNSNSDTKGTVTFHGRLNNVMRTVWSALILLVSMLQGKVYLMCMYLLNLV